MQNRLIPNPGAEALTLFQNINRDTSLFLDAAHIKKDSEKHKALRKTIQALHRQLLHPYKYVEEQLPEVNRVIARAQISLPWLAKYEDCWPARIYLKRYVDGRRPHLQCPRHAYRKGKRVCRSLADHKPPQKELQVSTAVPKHDSIVMKFLASLMPSLEHHFDTFIKLGIRDQKTLRAFLSWPQATQSQFLDEEHRSLQLTSLEKKGLLVGCGQLAHRALETSLDDMAKPGYFRS